MGSKGRLSLKKLWPMALAALGVFLMLLPNFSDRSEEKPREEDPLRAEESFLYSEMLEEKLCRLISGAEGVGNAHVVVTLDRGVESVLAQNETSGEKSVSVDYVIMQGSDGEEAVPIAEIYPRVRGVAVVCEGGESPGVQERVVSLISAALGISASRIAVTG